MILEKFKVTDKIAIITGAMGGIGFAIADTLGQAGAKINTHRYKRKQKYFR